MDAPTGASSTSTRPPRPCCSYCPPLLPHSPRFLWFCERCRAQVYEAVFEVHDYAENPVSAAYREYYGSVEHRTCKACGHVLPVPEDRSFEQANPVQPSSAR